MSKIVGQIRISPLSKNLLRIEEKGPSGFEDRPTFLVVNRDWPELPAEVCHKGKTVCIKTEYYEIEVFEEGKTFKDVKVYDNNKNLLWNGSEWVFKTERFSVKGKSIYVLPDTPRVVPPPGGPLPENVSEWVINNDSPDIYIFIHKGDISLLRKDYLKLTGKIAMPPLWAFGFWNSLYHAYTDKEALETIKKYRKEDIPLDVFVVDTDWRVGGSSGYDIEKKYFPNMEDFFKKAHKLNVKVVMNDHPGSRGMDPIEPEHLKYRHENLTRFLSMGLDTWWYDKNWHEFIEGPVEGIGREVWGQYLYWNIISRFRPGMRTFLLSMWSSHPASHRYPIWWTGDIHSSWDDLRDGIRETLWYGEQCMPYVGQDLGGHVGDPDDELYTRFLQYGCLSPTARVHGSVKTKRYPWQYKKETKDIVREYIKLRYRLLPAIYSAARKAWEDGTPLLKHPLPENKRNDYLEYIFCEDLLVAPVYTQKGYTRIESRFFNTDGNEGLKGEYFSNKEFTGAPELTRIDKEISFPQWTGEHVELWRESFGIRWTGELSPPETGKYTFRTLTSDGIRLWVGDRLVIDNWTDHHQTYNSGDITLEKGKREPFRIDYFNTHGFWIIRLDWIKPSDRNKEKLHKLYIPEGQWEDLWTGEIKEGPQEIQVPCPLYKIPLFVRRGGIIITAPEMNYMGEHSWNPLILEIFPPDSGEVIRTLYEDDGCTPGYETGEFKKTDILCSGNDKNINITLENSRGSFKRDLQERTFIFRIHMKQGEKPEEIYINGHKSEGKDFSLLEPESNKWPWVPLKRLNPPKMGGVIVEISLPVKNDTVEIKIKRA